MSADRIGECPSCKCYALREYFEFSYQDVPHNPDGIVAFCVKYEAECRECLWKHRANFVSSATVAFTTKEPV